MTSFRRSFAIAAAVALSWLVSTAAAPPDVYAIRGARVITAAGPTVENGTVIVRNGLIEAVGSAVTVPADATVIEGKGLTVYPGLIDMGTGAALNVPPPQQPQSTRTRQELERHKRDSILRPQIQAVDYLQVESPDLKKLAAAGITTVLSTPGGEVLRGQSALVNVVPPPEDPQIGTPAGPRRGLVVLKTPVALHVTFTERPRGDGYPESLMGVIAFVRQAFLDAQHYQLVKARYDRDVQATERPDFDAALDAMQAAVEGKLPVAFEANRAREIVRVLDMSSELKLTPIITGAVEAPEVAQDLKGRNARVIFSLNYPTRPKNLAPDADEPLRVVRSRANAPKAPAALQQAGVLFAFESGGLENPKDFVKNAARAVKEGLASDAAIKALTLNAATIAGVERRVGSLEKGKIANLVVTDGDLFDEKTTIKRVFVDGRPVALEEPARPARVSQ